MSQMIRPEFDTQELSQAGLERVEAIRAAFSRLLNALLDHRDGEYLPLLKPSRETSIVITKLQEACMFAVRSAALDLANQR